MADRTAHDVTDNARRLAREWAEFIESRRDNWTDRIRSAARVILNAVPTPPRPTLADMTPEERAACQWMQADVEGQEPSAVITYPDRGRELVKLIDRWGKMIYAGSNLVTPRPDLPRMEWPGDQKPDPAPALPEGWRLADHEDHGRVIVTTPTPDDDGDFYFAFPVDDLTGYDWDACRPDELTFLDQGADQ